MSNPIINATNLSGKIALVTGASRGIGRAAARTLAKAGARVLVHYGNAADQADALVTEIRAAGGQADAVGADLAAPDGAHVLANKVRALVNRVDVLVNNAGVAIFKPLKDTTVADFDRLFAVNVRAPYFLVQQLLPLLGEGANIIFTSSVVARTAVPDLVAYSATKGAVDTLIKQLAAQLGPQGIRVNGIAPGVIDTDMSSFVGSPEGRDFTLGIQALKRVGQPDDIGDVVAFVASNAARWITGETIQVSGGTKL